jgi:hypothetical protein
MANVEFIDLVQELREDARGFSFFPLLGRVRHPLVLPSSFHLVSIVPGQNRGHHLHPRYEEWLYPFHGTGVFLWEAAPGKVKERPIAGNRILIHILPGVAHAMTCRGPGPLYLLAWREPVGDPTDEPETVPRVI